MICYICRKFYGEMKVYGKIFMVAAAASVAAACGNMGLTREELRTIDSADSNGIMRVLTINDRTDSLMLRSLSTDFAEEDLERMFADSLSPCARLASQMVATVTSPEQDGVGIAGPQVGLSRRIVAVQRFDKEGSPFEVYPNIRIVAVEPASSAVLSGGKAGPHKIQGIGAGFVPSIYDASVVDEVLPIENDDAIRSSREVASVEGLLVGISAGAAIAAATQIAKRPENRGKTIVALLPDTGERYLSTELYAFDSYPL